MLIKFTSISIYKSELCNVSIYIVENFLVCKNDKSISILKEWLRFQVISSDITDDSHLVYNILISHAHISFSCQTTVKQTVKNYISMFDLSWQKKWEKKFWNMVVHEWYSKWKICVWDKFKKISFWIFLKLFRSKLLIMC